MVLLSEDLALSARAGSAQFYLTRMVRGQINVMNRENERIRIYQEFEERKAFKVSFRRVPTGDNCCLGC